MKVTTRSHEILLKADVLILFQLRILTLFAKYSHQVSCHQVPIFFASNLQRRLIKIDQVINVDSVYIISIQ